MSVPKGNFKAPLSKIHMFSAQELMNVRRKCGGGQKLQKRDMSSVKQPKDQSLILPVNAANSSIAKHCVFPPPFYDVPKVFDG